MRSAWFVALAIVAYIAVGCRSPATQSIPIVDTPGIEAVPTREHDLTPAAVMTMAPARTPAALLAIDPQPAPQSGQVHIAGKGFEGGESVSVSIARTADATSDRLPLASAHAGAEGSFDAITLALPDTLQSGAHALEAVGQASGRRGSATLWIRAPQPWLVLDSYDTPQYGDVGLVAGGFESMDQVDVSLEPSGGASGTSVRLVSLTTDQAGNAAWTQLKLPRLAAGTYTMLLRGQANAAELRREVHVTPLKPTIELSPWAGPPGMPIQLNARGFAPSERIHVALGAAQDPAQLQADEYGNLWGAGPVRIPQNATPGTLALSVTGDDSGAVSTAEFKVLEPKPWLELTAWSGAPGAPVGFGGGGWIGGERVSIHIGSATNPAKSSVVADDNGWLKAVGQVVYVPNDVEDDVIFVAVGEQSHRVTAATFKVVFPFGLHPAQSQPRANDGG